MKTHFDIAIVGGGMVGLSFALAVAAYDWRIALFDSQTLPHNIDNTVTDLRVSAINLASQQIFENLDIWQAIKGLGASPFRHMQVWDKRGEIKFHASDIHQAHLGHIIENKVMRHVLTQHLARLGNVQLFENETLTALDLANDKVSLTLANGKVLTSQLLVGADGARSWVRQQADIDLKQHDYGQRAIVAMIANQHSHCQTAWQRFLPTGPLAHLPLNDKQQTSIVWSCALPRAEELMALSDEAFANELSLAFDNRLGESQLISQRVCFPLTMRHVKTYTKPRLALLGDAAHTLHPLAGQGVNLGLLDAASLAEKLRQGEVNGLDFASYRQLRAYERERKTHNLAMIALMESFKRVFSNESSVLSGLRNLGLTLGNQLPLLKNQIMHYAIGLNGDLPPLAKPLVSSEPAC